VPRGLIQHLDVIGLVDALAAFRPSKPDSDGRTMQHRPVESMP